MKNEVPPALAADGARTGEMAVVIQQCGPSRKRNSAKTDYAARARELFEKHLDLAPLKHRDHGYVQCIFHRDRTPSLHVDLARGIFYCHGCHVGGGAVVFARRVGKSIDDAPVHPRRPLAPEEEGQRDALRWEQSSRDQLARYADAFALADMLRREYRRVTDVRMSAKEDTAATWDLLSLAADLERELWQLEDHADEALIKAEQAARGRS